MRETEEAEIGILRNEIFIINLIIFSASGKPEQLTKLWQESVSNSIDKEVPNGSTTIGRSNLVADSQPFDRKQFDLSSRRSPSHVDFDLRPKSLQSNDYSHRMRGLLPRPSTFPTIGGFAPIPKK